MHHCFHPFFMVLVLTGMTLSNTLYAIEEDHHPAGNQSAMTSHVPFRPLKLEDIERFHGHLGPFVLLGVRMGEHACGELKMPRFFDLTVVAECPDGPPHTCLIDGLQLSTGATMGKENIAHKHSEQIRVTLKEVSTGRTVVYSLKDATQEQLEKWKADKVSLDDQSTRIYEMKPEDLFEIAVTPPSQPK